MTLTVTVLTREYAACVVDRRLSRARSVVSEQARKLIQLDTGNFKGLLAYNGIGRTPKGETPNDWVSEAMKNWNGSIVKFCERLTEVSEPRLRAIAPYCQGNPKHSFIIAGFDNHIPVMGMISNYEKLGEADLTIAEKKMTTGLLSPKRDPGHGYIISGATNIVRKRSQIALRESLERNVSRSKILSKMTKIIRDTAYRDRKGGSVGSGVLSSVYDPINGFLGDSSTVGGSSYFEMPDVIFQGTQFRDIWMTGMPKRSSRYNPKLGQFDFVETKCENCGNPVPEGHRQCPSCDFNSVE